METHGQLIQSACVLGLLGLPEDFRNFIDLSEELIRHCNVDGALGSAGTGKLGGLVKQFVEIGVLLKVRWFEVIGPQNPKVLLDQVRALLFDEEGARLEVHIVRCVVLLHAYLDRLSL